MITIAPTMRLFKWSGQQADVYENKGKYHAYIHGGGTKERVTENMELADLLEDLLKRGFDFIDDQKGNRL